MENEELTIEVIKAKTIKGVAALTSRTFILQIITFFSTFLLTIFLNPSEYGTFFLVSAVINFFTFFSDVGLAAALIQKKESLEKEELRTTFTVQQILVLSAVIIILTLTPVFQSVYKLDQSSVYLIYALAFSLILSSLKTIPSVILERRLDFNKLIIPQIAESLAFYGIAVLLAWKGFGINSFTIAVLVRGIVGLVIMYLLQPWMPGFMFSKTALNRLLKFGLPYQANTFLAMVKDDGMTAVLGGIIGSAGIGYLGWAQKWAAAPLRFFMDQVIKVTFPAYSRLQHEPAELSKAVNRSLFFISLLVFPSLVGLVTLAPLLTKIIPKYGKWEPALLALSIICINTFFAAISTPLTNFLSAIGKIKITFRLMIMWTALTWILIPFLAFQYGFNGAAFGYAIVGLSSIVAIYIGGKYTTLHFWPNIGKPLVSAAVMGLSILVIKYFLPANFTSIIILITEALLVYSAMIVLLVGKSIILDFKKVIKNIKP